MIPSKNSTNVANAVGGKTARACDSCGRKRARWYCAADDAFLCEACDSSVHSANPLARRHERVRLKTASLKSLDLASINKSRSSCVPSWHRGFTRKARTPRNNKQLLGLSTSKIDKEVIRNPIPLVPEVGSDENELSHEENEEEQLLYRVPIYEPNFVAELCSSTQKSCEAAATSTAAAATTPTAADSSGIESNKAGLFNSTHGQRSLHGEFLPSDMDIAEFAADVESLLGRGLENESFGMEELGLVDCNEEEDKDELRRGYSVGQSNSSTSKVKIEEEESSGIDVKEGGKFREYEVDIDMAREAPFELSLDDYNSPAGTCGEEDDEKKTVMFGEIKELKKRSDRSTASCNNKNINEEEEITEDDDAGSKKKRRRILLSLDYEAIITAWASHGSSPWTTGNKPDDFDPDECLPDCTGACGMELENHAYGDGSGVGGNGTIMGDGEREARVSRYREKRRTRLFSKKIRYEVRKLNAEKRPRMKGRFVKRAATYAAPACT